MEPQFVETYYDTADKAVTDKPTRVYWIFVDVKTLATQGLVYIRDGYSTSDTIKIKIRTGYSRPHCFCPAIRCAHGLFIEMDTNVTSYTVGYREERDIPSKE